MEMGSRVGDHVEGGGEEGGETLRRRQRMVALLLDGGHVTSTLLTLASRLRGAREREDTTVAE